MGTEQAELPDIASALRETWQSAVRQVDAAESALAAAKLTLEERQARADEIKRQIEAACPPLGLDAAALLVVDHPTQNPTAPVRSGPPHAAERNRTRATYEEHLIDLLGDGRLVAGEQLRTVHHGQEHFARLEADGFITGPSIGSKPTLTAAARALVGGERNGWKFWTVLRDGRWMPVADLRRG